MANGPDMVGDSLRETDRSRYLATLVLPEDKRAAVVALYAFAADCAAIRGKVKDPAAGEVRLQWWADALSGEGHGEVRQNPVAAALLDTMRRYRLPAAPLLRLINSRRFDLYHDPMPDVASFEGYAGDTASAIHQLAAMILNDGEMVEPGDAAGHLGVAEAMLGHLRAFGFNASQGRIFLPMAVFAAHGVSEDTILSGRPDAGISAALAQAGEMATDHLRRAAAAIVGLPVPLRPAFALVAALGLEARRIGAVAAQPFAHHAAPADWRRIAAMALWTWRNR